MATMTKEQFFSKLGKGSLSGITIPNLDLSGLDLSGRRDLWDEAILPQVNLTSVSMRSTLLLSAVMHGAIFDRTDLSPSGNNNHLAYSDWYRCDLSGAIVRNHTIFNHGAFNETKWVGAKFESVSMEDTYFNWSDWRNVVFGEGVILNNVRLMRTDLRGADLSLAIVSDWSTIDLHYAVMNHHTKMPRGFQSRDHQINWLG